ncbi:MAG: hypothetical protein QXN04_10650 [Pyrobaculum sp.]
MYKNGFVLDGRCLLVFLTLASFVVALPYFGVNVNVVPDVGWRAEEGTIAVMLTPDLATKRKEIYLRERLWLAFQVRNVYSPCPLSILVRDLETGEVVFSRAATVSICGGQMGPGMYWTGIIPDFTIVEPVLEGRRYKIEVRVGGEYGGYTFVERHNPVGRISSISILREGRVVTRLTEGVSHVVRTTVENRGEVDYVFNVSLYLNGVKVDSKRASIPARRSATIDFTVVPQVVGTVELEVVVRGVVDTDRQKTSIDVVSPYPRFVLLEPRRVEARVGEPYSAVIRLRNVGESCLSPVVSIDQPWVFNYTGGAVVTGGVLEVSIRFTPITAASGVAVLRVRCGDYTSQVEIPFLISARVRTRAESLDGRFVAATLTLNGSKIEDAWLPPGRYLLEAPVTVPVGEGTRWRFDSWSDGVVEPRRVVEIRHNIDLVARYVLEYRVELSVLNNLTAIWVREGQRVAQLAPSVVPLNETYRLVFTKWEGPGCPHTLEFSVYSPMRCVAIYKTEFRVIIEDPTGRYKDDVWTSSYVKTIPRDLFLGEDTRLFLTKVDCPHSEEGGYIRLEFNQPARCRLHWQREYRVSLASGLPDRLTEWVGWMREGATIRLIVGGDRPMAKEGELVLPQQVEVGNARYKLRGWTCGGEVHVVERPTRCEGLWDVEYRVRISIYLDGRLIDVKTMWASGPMTLDADRFKPPPPTPLALVEFEKWDTATTPRIDIEINQPLEMAIHWRTNYTPLVALVVALIATAAVVAATFAKKRKKRIEVEVIGEETKTR